MLMKSKKGMKAVINGLTMSIISVIIGFIVVFYIIGGLAPTLVTASQNISGSGLPLSSLFGSSGVIFIIFMVILLVGLIVLAMRMVKGGK